jgi:uncharacterized protein YggE
MRPFFALGICLISLAPAFSQTTEPPLISVTGTAEIKVAPDEVVLLVNVETRHENMQEAKKENDAIAGKAIALLKSKGIKDEAIQTSYISLNARYDDEKGPTKPIYFSTSKSIEVIINKVDAFESILTGLLATGVNEIEGITFRHSNSRNLRNQARAMAVKAAIQKADALAAELDVKRGKVFRVDADDNGGRYYAGNSLSNVGGAGGLFEDTSAASDGGFSIGQISVSATVNASFLIE